MIKDKPFHVWIDNKRDYDTFSKWLVYRKYRCLNFEYDNTRGRCWIIVNNDKILYSKDYKVFSTSDVLVGNNDSFSGLKLSKEVDIKLFERREKVKRILS